MKKNKKKVKIDVILLYFRRRRIRDALMKRWWELEAKRKAELYPSFDSQKAVIHNALANQKVQQHFQELIKRAVVK